LSLELKKSSDENKQLKVLLLMVDNLYFQYLEKFK
jgi:hypothetical protein